MSNNMQFFRCKYLALEGSKKKNPYTSDGGEEDFQTPGAYPGSVGGFALISDVQTNNAWFTAGLSHLHSASEQESSLLWP